MKTHTLLLVALLGLSVQADACSNPTKDAIVQQDLGAMRKLGQQYHLAGKSISNAWNQEVSAKQQGDLVAMALASEQLALYRFQLGAIKAALSSVKTKLSVDIRIAAKSPCPPNSAED